MLEIFTETRDKKEMIDFLNIILADNVKKENSDNKSCNVLNNIKKNENGQVFIEILLIDGLIVSIITSVVYLFFRSQVVSILNIIYLWSFNHLFLLIFLVTAIYFCIILFRAWAKDYQLKNTYKHTTDDKKKL